jgi:hypothetical protein
MGRSRACATLISVKVDETGIIVTDNGPEIPESTVEGVLDFTVRVSSREAYIVPDRGAQGNAGKTLIAHALRARWRAGLRG